MLRKTKRFPACAGIDPGKELFNSLSAISISEWPAAGLGHCRAAWRYRCHSAGDELGRVRRHLRAGPFVEVADPAATCGVRRRPVHPDGFLARCPDNNRPGPRRQGHRGTIR